MDIIFYGFKIINKVAYKIPQRLSINVNENFYRALKSVLKIRRVENIPLVRVGKVGDGGYIMIDKFITGGGGRHRLTPSVSLLKFLGMPIWQNAATMFSCTT